MTSVGEAMAMLLGDEILELSYLDRYTAKIVAFSFSSISISSNPSGYGILFCHFSFFFIIGENIDG